MVEKEIRRPKKGWGKNPSRKKEGNRWRIILVEGLGGHPVSSGFNLERGGFFIDSVPAKTHCKARRGKGKRRLGISTPGAKESHSGEEKSPTLTTGEERIGREGGNVYPP